MDVDLLNAARSAQLAAQPLTYPPPHPRPPGEAPPPGYARFSRTRRLVSERTFAELADDLMSWRVHTRSGLRVEASAPTAEVGAVVLMRLGIGPVSVAVPCRVVAVVDEADRRGFAYGTLPGHPESGEESFVLSRTPDFGVEFTVSAFSRPATRLARLGGPVTTAVQRFMTGRYLHALDRPGRTSRG